MVDFLSSPILFPSDMDSPKLSAGPSYKLPEPANWVDHDYYSTMVDKTMTSLTGVMKLDPVEKNQDTHVYAPFIAQTDTQFLKNHHQERQHRALLTLAKSMIHAYNSPFCQDQLIPEQVTTVDEKQRQLHASLRGALDIVEKDMQKNGTDTLFYPSSHPQNHDDMCDRWSWHEDMVDVPDLVYSACSSPSSHSLVDDQYQSTAILLESGLSSGCDDGISPNMLTITSHHNHLDVQQVNQPSDPIMPSSPTLPLSLPSSKKKKSKTSFKKWFNNARKDTIHSLSATTRKLCRWVKT